MRCGPHGRLTQPLGPISDMTTAEKIEVTLIPLVGATIWLMGEWLPTSMGIGSLLLASSMLLLFQGLLRDLWLLFKQKRDTQSGTRQELLCMCVESTVGVTGVVAGIIIFGSAIKWPVPMSSGIWSLLALAVLAMGFAIKDLIFEWRPFRIRRDKNHSNIVFSWKS
jgi:hypothetical protein